jgi:hypothetical protein
MGVDAMGSPIQIQQFQETRGLPFSTAMPNWNYWGVIDR